jgi:hypothetical protein
VIDAGAAVEARRIVDLESKPQRNPGFRMHWRMTKFERL